MITHDEALDIIESDYKRTVEKHGAQFSDMDEMAVVLHSGRHGVKFELAQVVAASVLMQKDRSKEEVYNDLDEDIVNVFRVLRDRDSAQQLRRLFYQDMILSYTMTYTQAGVCTD